MSAAHRADCRHYVYRIFDADSRLIYVGCTYGAEARINFHRNTIWWADQIDRIKITVHPDKKSGHEAEREAIRAGNPRWNLNTKWANRDTWDAKDCADYITAMILHPNNETPYRRKRLAEAKQMLIAA